MLDIQSSKQQLENFDNVANQTSKEDLLLAISVLGVLSMHVSNVVTVSLLI
jgi:hypothetical protein